MGNKKIFIICSVRGATEEYRKKLEAYVAKLEVFGNKVHLPHRDTIQAGDGLDICTTHRQIIEGCDEVHLFYTPESQGTHFDLGMAFMAKKPLVVVESVPFGEGKSFAKMTSTWEQNGVNGGKITLAD